MLSGAEVVDEPLVAVAPSSVALVQGESTSSETPSKLVKCSPLLIQPQCVCKQIVTNIEMKYSTPRLCYTSSTVGASVHL